MFGNIWSGFKSAWGSFTNVGRQALTVVPVIGPPLVAGLEAVDVLIRGGGVTTTSPQGETTRYGSSARPGLSSLLSMNVLGIPVIYMIPAGVIAWLFFRKKGR